MWRWSSTGSMPSNDVTAFSMAKNVRPCRLSSAPANNGNHAHVAQLWLTGALLVCNQLHHLHFYSTT